MQLARVIGTVVATVKNDSLRNRTLLVVQSLNKNHRYENARVMLCETINPEGEATGHTVLALDSVDSGVGDTVLIVQEGWSASTSATGKAGAAIDSAIVGVVDRIDLLEEV